MNNKQNGDKWIIRKPVVHREKRLDVDAVNSTSVTLSNFILYLQYMHFFPRIFYSNFILVLFNWFTFIRIICISCCLGFCCKNLI